MRRFLAVIALVGLGVLLGFVVRLLLPRARGITRG